MNRPDRDPSDVELRSLLRRLPPSRDCPPEERWLELAAGELAVGEVEVLRSHLADCAACTAAAADARRFHLAMAPPEPARPRARFRRWAVGAAAAAAAVAVIATAVGLARRPVARAAADPVAAFVEVLEPPALPASGGDPVADELLYRGDTSPAARHSLAAALTPYRVRDFAAACRTLAAHGERFPADREARYLAAMACLKTGELDRGEALLASLAASAGERRDDARQVLERLQRARRDGGR